MIYYHSWNEKLHDDFLKKNENSADSDKYVNSTREVEGLFKNQKCVVYLGVAITEGVSNYYSKFTTGLHHINFKALENSI